MKTKIVCFCGSTKFAETFMIERWKLEKKGIITLGINILPNGYFEHESHHGAEQEGVKEILDELHKRKIDISDEIIILNVGGYIGESTKKEIEYAKLIGKPIKYLEPLNTTAETEAKKFQQLLDGISKKLSSINVDAVKRLYFDELKNQVKDINKDVDECLEDLGIAIAADAEESINSLKEELKELAQELNLIEIEISAYEHP